MFRRPRVLGLTLCDRMEINPATGKVSLVGIFQAMHFRDFQAARRSFTIYFALYDGAGEGIIELAITQLETEKDILYKERRVTFPGRGLVMNMEFPVQNCRFPAPGNYAITLHIREKAEVGI